MKTISNKKLENEMIIISNKARFITEVLEDKIDLRKKKKDEVNKMLSEAKYDIIEDDNDYKYLVRLPMDSVTEENVEKLLKDKNDKNTALMKLKNLSEKEIWMVNLII